jgi:hypothetical protein
MPTRRLPTAGGVGVASGAELVVGASSETGGDRGEHPEVVDAGEATVAGVSGEHDLVFAGLAGDGRRRRLVLARLGVSETVRVIPELGERRGAQDRPDAWKRADDLGVRVLVKTL